jgi:SNF2 family DNA or RNA helicase
MAIDGQWLRVDTRPLQTLRGLILELFNRKKLDKPVRLPAYQAALLQDLPTLDNRKAPLTRALLTQLKDFNGLISIDPPTGLLAQLRPYQQQGLNWLAFLQQFGFGGILADDMGLGKTLQTLALLLHLKNSGQLKKPVLVVCPTSLTSNWLHEARRFTPQLRTCLIQGSKRKQAFVQIDNSDLVITTYPLLPRDVRHYAEYSFSMLILDEAQLIKNPNTRIASDVRTIKCDTRLCLSGTPLENHLGELWALMDFALPGLLGGQKTFNKQYRSAIEEQHDQDRQHELARRIAPFMLRRTKADVAQDLPPKTEIVQYVELEGKQRTLYESIRISMEKRIRDLIAQKGMARSHIEFLDALLKLRQACIDPRLVKLDKAADIIESAKLNWLSENIPVLLDEGRHILLFSQFTQVLGLIELLLNSKQIAYAKLTGQTRHRQTVIDQFQSGEVSVFLVSLKAGGSGLNLTAADVVIHVDPWWNPAVENQATDRAYRIGQDKPVFVYKLVAANTIEERIQQLQKQKQALADSLFSDAGAVGLPVEKEALMALLAS